MNARGAGDAVQLARGLRDRNGFILKPCITLAAIVHAYKTSTGKEGSERAEVQDHFGQCSEIDIKEPFSKKKNKKN